MATYKLKRKVFTLALPAPPGGVNYSAAPTKGLFDVWGNLKGAAAQHKDMKALGAVGDTIASNTARLGRNAALGKAALGTALIGGAAWGVNKLMGGSKSKNQENGNI